ncbi:MAG: Transcriptional repressor FrmR [Pseudomonas sp.]|nr:MAG: Transcriptional repressor FrmR [Pseudomonas sp.]
MVPSIKSKKQLQTRVRKIRGQMNALETALAEGRECAVILQQIAAVRGAVNGLMTEVMDGHIRERLTAEGLSSEGRIDEAEKISCLLRSYLK